MTQKTVKLVRIVNAIGETNSGPLQRLAQEKMPGSVAFKVARNIRIFSREMETYGQAKNDLINQYGDTEEDGSIGINQESAKWGEFAKAFDELLNTEISLDITLLTESDVSSINVSPIDLLILDFLFEDVVSDIPKEKPTTKRRRARSSR